MYDWTDIEASRQHRDDLLREAATRRLTRNLPGSRLRDRVRTLTRTVRWEMHRDLQRASKRLRAHAVHERT